MSVVKRCQNCGTTQATTGECETCHEAQVRYFCTNHEPGVWLAGPTCPQCEALAARPAASPSPAPPRPRARPVAERPLDLRPSRPALEDEPPRMAIFPRSTPPSAVAIREREPASLAPARGWLAQLVRRLVLIALVLIAALGLAVYLVARSFY